MPGQAHDLHETRDLLQGLNAGHLLADRAFDADWLRNDLLERGITPIIPPKSNRKFPAEFDKETYKWRHLVENYFGKLKENRGIAMRSCKNRSKLYRLHLDCSHVDRVKVNVNRP